MDTLFRRLRANLSARLHSFWDKQKVVPYSSEEDVNHQHSCYDRFSLLNSQPSFNGLDADFMSFLLTLNVECVIRSTVRTQHRCHDASAIAYFTLSEYANSPNFNELLSFLKITHSVSNRDIPIPLIHSAISQLRDLVDDIHKAIKGQVAPPGSLSLGDEAGAVVDLAIESLTTLSSSIKIDSRILNAVGLILKAIHSLFSNLEFNEDQSKIIWCQVITKVSQFVECLLYPAAPSTPDDREEQSHATFHSLVPQDIALVLQSLSPIVTLLRDMVGLPLAAPPIMAFWAVCDSALLSVSSALLHGSIRPSTAKTCYSTIYRLLASTSPSPQELSALIHSPTLKVSQAKKDGPASGTAANISPSHQNRGQPFSHHHPHHSRKLRSSSNISVWDRIIYVLIGFQYLLNGAIGADYVGASQFSLSQPLPRQMEWINSLGEALLTSVQSTATKQLRNSSKPIAELLFLAVLASSPPQKGGAASSSGPKLTELKWLFLELSDLVNKFSEAYAKKNVFITRLAQLSISISTRMSGRPPSTGAVHSCRSLDSGPDLAPMRPRRFSTGNGAISISRGHSPLFLAGTGGRDTQSPGRSSINSENTCNVYNVGDAIDALCAVQNGTQRWFPGSITGRTQVESSSGADSPLSSVYAYSVLFNDGETKENVPGSDIRFTKNCRSRSSSRVSSSRRDSHSHGSFPHLVPPNVSFTSEVVRGLEKVVETSPEKKQRDQPASKSCANEEEDDEDLLLRRLDRAHTNKSLGIAAVASVPSSVPPLNSVLFSRPDGQQQLERTTLKTDISLSSSTPKTTDNVRSDALGSAGEIFETPVKVYSPVQFLSKSNRRRKDSLGSLSIDDAMDTSYEDYDDDDDDDEDDNSVFVIPLVYSRQGSARGGGPSPAPPIQPQLEHVAFASTSGVVVPRMQLEKLDLASSVDHGGSTASLSGALLRESSKKNLLSDNSGCASPLEALSPRGAVDKVLSEFAKDDSSVGSLTRIESWRDSVGWNTRRSMPKSSRMNASSNSLLSLVNLSNAQSSQDALKIIQVAQSDIQEEISAMESITGTYEVIASFILYGALAELAEKNVMISERVCSGGVTGTKSEDISNPIGSTSNASGQAESALSFDVSRDYDDFEDAHATAESPSMSHTALFAVREFLDLDIPCIAAAQVLSTSSFIGPGAVRMLKLLSKTYFTDSCISLHLKNSDRLSAGAFGSVFQVCCPSECSVALKGAKDCHYAVKRIVRERSIHDAAIILDIFSEISCLERMSSCRGVCMLVDYGVYEGEYWIVMEKGRQDLLEWVQLHLPCVDTDSSVIDCFSPIKVVDRLLTHICLFAECLRIVRDVHMERIIHFDIKCSNFIMREGVNLDELVQAVMSDDLSGCIFLADFGESLSASETHYFHTQKKRSRGTLPVQSPEMLSVNNSSDFKWQQRNCMSTEPPSYGCDIWSLGCMLFEMVTGKFLFENKSWTELYCMLCMEHYKPPNVSDSLTAFMGCDELPADVNSTLPTLTKIVHGMLQQHPADRTKFCDILKDVKSVVSTLHQFRAASDEAVQGVSFSSSCKEAERAIVQQQLSISRNILSLEGFPVGNPEPRRDETVVTRGVWLVGPVVSVNIGSTYEPIIDGSSTAASQPRVSPTPLAQRHGVVASLFVPPSSKASADRSVSSLDEFEMNMSAIMSNSVFTSSAAGSPASSGPAYNDLVFKRMITRCISNQFSTVSPPLSYYTMSTIRHMKGSLTRVVSTVSEDDNLCTSLFKSPTLACPATPTATVVRIGDHPGMKGAENMPECGLVTGSLTPAFLSPVQYHCLLSNDLNYKQLCSRALATLRFSLNEVHQGKCISVVVDSKPVGMSSFSPRYVCSPDEKQKVEVAPCRLTVALFLACAISTYESSSKEGKMNGKSHGDYIAEYAEKEFRWCINSIDTELYRRLCGEVDINEGDVVSGTQ